ncbi:MAG TPA: SNF2-related protein [Actinomycetes bacterium]|nr:SNF2-related protein [Actinomycetes bacterium]
MARFAKGDQVTDRRSGDIGVVLKAEPAGRSVMYRVQFATASRYLAEEALEAASFDPIDRLKEHSIGHPGAFHLRLRALLLEHAYRHDAYSGLTNARIEPKAHQVSVAARVLDKVRPRMLLADEVGLGKTIEAALVLKELLARRIAERILIICPASLLTQWENELRSKFNEQFTLIDSLTLKYFEKQGHANPFLAFDRGLCSIHLARSRGRAQQIVDAGWDVVVVDEAHHLAPKPSANKLFALVNELSTDVFGLLLLTATPIQLRASELFHLVELVEPGTFTDLLDFERRRTDIPKLNALWKALDKWPVLDSTEQRETMTTHRRLIQEVVPSANGDLGRVLRGDDGRRAVQRRLEERHPYLNVMVRNRKSVLDLGVRRNAHTVHCPQSSLEAETYEAVTTYLRDQYDMAIGAKNNARGFLMVIYLKILSSSTYALAQCFGRRVARLTEPKKPAKPKTVDKTLLRELAETDEALNEVDAAVPAVEQEMRILRDLIQRLNQVEDAKVDHLLGFLDKTYRTNPGQKVLIFTQSLDTQEFLRRKLLPAYEVGVFNGRMSIFEKDQAVAVFRDRGQILISTESGGEGRNFQFCHILVNYDLSWNPMRVEQRIGRLDRIGQKHVVQIQNLVATGTIEERVERVLRERIGVFEESVGSLDLILGEGIEEQLEAAAFADPARLDEEFQRIELSLEHRVFEARRMEEQLEDFILDKNSLRRDEAARILQHREGTLLPELRAVVTDAVDALGGTVDRHADGGEVISLPLLAAQRLGRTKQPRLRGTFDPDEALRLEEIDFFAFGHPAVEQLLGEASVGRPERVTTAYEAVSGEPFEGVEVVYRLRTVGLQENERILLVRASFPEHVRSEQITRWVQSGRSTPPESFALWGNPDALEQVVSTCNAEAFRQLEAFIAVDRESGERWLKREIDREQRIYAKRLAAAEHRVNVLTEDYAVKSQSDDLGDRRILPAIRGQLEKARDHVREVESNHVQEVERLQGKVEPTGDFEILAAALVRACAQDGT